MDNLGVGTLLKRAQAFRNAAVSKPKRPSITFAGTVLPLPEDTVHFTGSREGGRKRLRKLIYTAATLSAATVGTLGGAATAFADENPPVVGNNPFSDSSYQTPDNQGGTEGSPQGQAPGQTHQGTRPTEDQAQGGDHRSERPSPAPAPSPTAATPTPAARPTPAPPSDSQPRAFTHTVKDGENPTTIVETVSGLKEGAPGFQAKHQKFMEANHLTERSARHIKPGDKLIVPADVGTNPAGGQETHTVRNHENPTTIVENITGLKEGAPGFHEKHKQFMDANHLTERSARHVMPGDKLIVPPGLRHHAPASPERPRPAPAPTSGNHTPAQTPTPTGTPAGPDTSGMPKVTPDTPLPQAQQTVRQLQQTVADNTKKSDDLQRQITAQQGQESQLTTDVQNSQHEVDQLQGQLTAAQQAGPQGVKLGSPTGRPVTAQDITPSGRGADLKNVQENAPIKAPGNGTVYVKPNNGRAGNTIDLDLGNGVVIRLGQVKGDFPVKNGQQVKAGDVIGYVGKPAGSSTPVLHVEMQVNRQQVDAAPYLTGERSLPIAQTPGTSDVATTQRQLDDAKRRLADKQKELADVQRQKADAQREQREAQQTRDRAAAALPDAQAQTNAIAARTYNLPTVTTDMTPEQAQQTRDQLTQVQQQSGQEADGLAPQIQAQQGQVDSLRGPADQSHQRVTDLQGQVDALNAKKNQQSAPKVTPEMQRLADAAKQKYPPGSASGGMCATGVKLSIQAALGGQYVKWDANQGDTELPKLQLPNGVHFVKVDGLTPEQAYQIPGLVVVYEHGWGADGAKYGHINVSVGNGQAVSDFYESNAQGHHPDGAYTVLAPVVGNTPALQRDNQLTPDEAKQLAVLEDQLNKAKQDDAAKQAAYRQAQDRLHQLQQQLDAANARKKAAEDALVQPPATPTPSPGTTPAPTPTGPSPAPAPTPTSPRPAPAPTPTAPAPTPTAPAPTPSAPAPTPATPAPTPVAPAPATPTPTPAPTPSTIYTPDVVKKILPDARDEAVNNNTPLLLDALHEQGIDDPQMVNYALATIQPETDITVNHQRMLFMPIDELGDASYFSKYDGRADLGNIHPGDGARYHGRGFVQITGRHNYTHYGQLLGVDLVNHPELAKDPKTAARIMALYLKEHEKTIRDGLNTGNLAKARKAVNGGTHGIATFTAAYQRAETESKKRQDELKAHPSTPALTPASPAPTQRPNPTPAPPSDGDATHAPTTPAPTPASPAPAPTPTTQAPTTAPSPGRQKADAAVAWARGELAKGIDEAHDQAYISRTYSNGNVENWCADFFTTAYQTVGNSPFGHIPGVDNLQTKASQLGALRDPSYVPKPGDAILFNDAWTAGQVDQSGRSHVEMVTSVDMKDGKVTAIHTIGGNTGDAVAERTHKPSEATGFIDIEAAYQNAH